MSIKTRTIQSGKIAIIDVKGSLVGDGDTDEFREAVADFIEQGNKCLIVNLQKATYLNSTGIGAIIAAHTSYVKNGGEVRLSGISKSVLNLFVVTKLIDIFDVYDTLDEATESFVKAKSIS
jgi:anti-sigma B factor antagonist